VKRAAIVLLVAGCGRPSPSPFAMPRIPITVDALLADSIARAIVQQAFDADAEVRNPDSLYIADAEVIANGAPRAEAPRFAGIGADGSVQLGSSRFAVTGNFVWGTIQYRWVPPSADKRMVDGWATLVLARLKTGEWRILHVHSSTAGPETN
jgi:hypothetical protein